ncbi:MAG: nucleotidyltransferase family protein [Rhodanobacter sp.]|nr:MAG: nucleotidyltransferase family protein [Rhodanobacter sp.]TAL99954.1 MAG: nucleotidyltransferase family protein [Rhodanobacter sp.]TAM38200.1 MAG: nucleotidyltransferase family protein [Rhodanobacter sp.]TAN26420.1 MAG: nucleotidyltransferase family protein [Rhodanobacter sp.]
MRHALIFAAGRGERMRPLTDHTPKPLLSVGGKPLIAWQLEKLAAAGVHYVVINTSHLAEQFPDTLGDGSRWGLRIRYAYEGATPLETGGGMLNALPLLGAEPFLAISGDIWCDVDFASLPAEPTGLAHLLMVDNPAHHPRGDFALDAQGMLHDTGEPKLTFGGIGVFRRELLGDWKRGTGAVTMSPSFKLRQALQPAIARQSVTGTRHDGMWTDVGTPARLAQIDSRLAAVAGNGDNTPAHGDAGLQDR